MSASYIKELLLYYIAEFLVDLIFISWYDFLQQINLIETLFVIHYDTGVRMGLTFLDIQFPVFYATRFFPSPLFYFFPLHLNLSFYPISHSPPSPIDHSILHNIYPWHVFLVWTLISDINCIQIVFFCATVARSKFRGVRGMLP